MNSSVARDIPALEQDYPEPPYLERYGLTRPPFLLQVEDDFFFAETGLVQRLDLMQHLTDFGALLLTVIGPRGSGKSTLLHQLVKRGRENWRVCHLQARQLLDGEALLREVGACFGLPTDGVSCADLHGALLQQLADMQGNGQLAVLVVDDAHEFPPSALQALTSLWSATNEIGRLLRVVLFAEPQIRELLAPQIDPDAWEQHVHVLDIPPLSELQTAAYVRHRLAVAGYAGPSPFTPAYIKNIHRASRGLPARINERAYQLLIELQKNAVEPAPPMEVPEPASHKRGGRSPTVYFVLGSIAVAAIATALFIPTSHKQERGSGVPIPLPPANESDERRLEEQHPIIRMHQPAVALPERVGVPLGEKLGALPPAENDLADVPLTGVSSVPPAAQPDAGTTSSTPEPQTQLLEPIRSPAVTAEQTLAPTARTAPDGPADISSETGNKPLAPAVTARAPAPIERSSAAPKREAWLLRQDPSHYMLQLLGVRNEAAVLAYVRRQNLKGDMAYFHTFYKGGDWYPLLYGVYPSRQAAMAAIEHLPAHIRSSRPWPRSIAAVQADIRAALPQAAGGG